MFVQYIAGYEGVHGGHGWGTGYTEDQSLLEFAVSCNLVIGNTCFKKQSNNLITYTSDEWRTQIDYVLFCKTFRKHVSDVKVIPGKEIAKQHNLLVCDYCADIPLPAKKKNMCRSTKKHQWQKETWWWNAAVDSAVKENQGCWKTWKKRWQKGGVSEGQAPRQTCCLFGNSQAKQEVLKDPYPAGQTFFALPTKWDAETWMSKMGNQSAMVLESCAWMSKSKSKKTLFNVGQCKQYNISSHLKWDDRAKQATRKKHYDCPSNVQGVPGKTCMQMTWSSSLNRWRNYNRSWSSGRPLWKERDIGSTFHFLWLLFQLDPQEMQSEVWCQNQA